VTFDEYLKAHEDQGFNFAQLAAIWGHLHPATQAQPLPPPAAICNSVTAPGGQQPQLAPPEPQPMQPIVATNQPTTRLRVRVPEPGLRAGQLLVFMAPAAGPGMQPQQMMVRVDEEAIPGSFVTVQYPQSQVPQAQAVGQHLPQPAIQVNPNDDQPRSNLLWALYVLGFLCACYVPLATIVLWLSAVCLYYRKPEQQRSQFPQFRIFVMIAGIMFLVCSYIVQAAVMDVDWITGGMHYNHSSGWAPAGPHGWHHDHHSAGRQSVDPHGGWQLETAYSHTNCDISGGRCNLLGEVGGATWPECENDRMRCWQRTLNQAKEICSIHADCVGITRDDEMFEPRRGPLAIIESYVAHELWLKHLVTPHNGKKFTLFGSLLFDGLGLYVHTTDRCVTEVRPGGPANKAGIRVGDCIVSVDDKMPDPSDPYLWHPSDPARGLTDLYLYIDQTRDKHDIVVFRAGNNVVV